MGLRLVVWFVCWVWWFFCVFSFFFFPCLLTLHNLFNVKCSSKTAFLACGLLRDSEQYMENLAMFPGNRNPYLTML